MQLLKMKITEDGRGRTNDLFNLLNYSAIILVPPAYLSSDDADLEMFSSRQRYLK